jgi:hypothetical protein
MLCRVPGTHIHVSKTQNIMDFVDTLQISTHSSSQFVFMDPFFVKAKNVHRDSCVLKKLIEPSIPCTVVVQ